MNVVFHDRVSQLRHVSNRSGSHTRRRTKVSNISSRHYITTSLTERHALHREYILQIFKGRNPFKGDNGVVVSPGGGTEGNLLGQIASERKRRIRSRLWKINLLGSVSNLTPDIFPGNIVCSMWETNWSASDGLSAAGERDECASVRGWALHSLGWSLKDRVATWNSKE